MSSAEWARDASGTYSRRLGDSELAFLPASQSGQGDMFLHLRFHAKPAFFTRARVLRAWALIRAQNPLLACRIKSDSYESKELGKATFEYIPPQNSQDAINAAQDTFEISNDSKMHLIEAYMDGPRQLCDASLSKLVLSSPSSDPSPTRRQFDLLIFAPHLIGDGNSLHQCAHELVVLLSRCAVGRENQLDHRIEIALEVDWLQVLPPAFETRLSPPKSKLAQAGALVNVLLGRGREIGACVFDRVSPAAAASPATEETVFKPTTNTQLWDFIFSEAETKEALRRCKARGVTINHALEAVCSIAWARWAARRRTQHLKSGADPNGDKTDVPQPMMVYTAANLRPHLSPHPARTPWFLALTYFTISMPGWLPASALSNASVAAASPSPTLSHAFWARALSAKQQSHRATRSPLLPFRALHMASTRAARAGGQPIPGSDAQLPVAWRAEERPGWSRALCGISLIGNLDRVYLRDEYGPDADVELEEVTTASRHRAGGLLVLGHTFGGRLWVQLCWDVGGFAGGEVEGWWVCLGETLKEVLCS